MNMNSSLGTHVLLLGSSILSLGPSGPPLLLSAITLPLLLHLATQAASQRPLLQIIPLILIAQFIAGLNLSISLFQSSGHAIALQLVWSVAATVGVLLPVLGTGLVQRKGWTAVGSWSELMVFPLFWTMSMELWAFVSPFGRLGAPSPSAAMLPAAIQPILQTLGQPGVDFMIASVAALVRTGSRKLVLDAGSSRETSHVQPDLLGDAEASETATKRSAVAATAKGSTGYNTFAGTGGKNDQELLSTSDRPALSLAGILTLAIAISATFFAPSPRPDTLARPITESTPLSLACIAPDLPATLASLLSESTRMASQAKMIVWPETSLTLSTLSERESVLNGIEELCKRQSIWVLAGLSSLKESDEGKRLRRRNEVVLVGPDGVVGSYGKRKLVPLVESYGHDAGYEGVPEWTIDLPPPAHVPKSTWTPSQPHIRPISISPLICLDAFHSPSLPPRSSFLLLSTHSPSAQVADLLLAQAQTLSVMHGVTTLMCDGAGAQGLSALIDGEGRVLHQQSGTGAFAVRTAVGWDGQESVRNKTGWVLLGWMGTWGVLVGFVAAGALVELVLVQGNSGLLESIKHSRRWIAVKALNAKVALQNRLSRTSRPTPTPTSLIDTE